MRHKQAPKRQIEGDRLYNDKLVAKFINYLMKDGKKIVAEKNLYKTFDIVLSKKQNALEVFERAIQNVGPKQEVKARRVGGASYQIPMEVSSNRRISLAMRWIKEAAEKRLNKEYHSFAEKLAAELLDASANQGEAVKKRDAVFRMAQANRAFAHFRW